MRRALALLLWLVVLLPALAQTPDTPTPTPDNTPTPQATASPSPSASVKPGKTFKVEEQQIEVKDRYGRPFLLPPNTGWLGVRLATGEAQHCKALKSFKEISSGGIEYPYKEDADYATFPLVDGTADVKFVIFTAAGKNPIDYQMTLLLGEGADQRKIELVDGVWSVGTGSAPSDVATESVAPHTQNEKLAMAFFGLLSVILLYVLYGRSLFARMLINKKYEVSSALGWSNVFMVIGLIGVAACLTGLWLWPRMLWDKTYWIYVVTIGGYLALLGVGYLVGVMATRR